MNRIVAAACVVCFATVAYAEGKATPAAGKTTTATPAAGKTATAAPVAGEAAAVKPTCGEVLAAKATIPAHVAETMVAVATYFEDHAADLATVKSKEAKAEAAEMKKLGKMHRDTAKQVKAISVDMEKQKALTGPADHPAFSEKTKAAMADMLTKQKELIAVLQKDVDEGEKMMSESPAKAGGQK